jgi:hypothetical protein
MPRIDQIETKGPQTVPIPDLPWLERGVVALGATPMAILRGIAWGGRSYRPGSSTLIGWRRRSCDNSVVSAS